MRNRKSIAAGITAAALVSAIGLAYAQSDDPSLPATPAEAIDRGIQPDLLKDQPVDDTLAPQDQQQQQQQTDATQQSQDSMANSTAQADLQTDTSSASSSTKAYSENPAPTYDTSSDTVERAPRADRN